MPYLEISSEKPTSLAKLGVPTILLKEVEVIDGDYRSLFHPIKISTKLPDGRFFQSLFHPNGYWSNTTPGNRTDVEINVSIHYCPFTELQVHSPDSLIKFRIQYDISAKEKLVVKVNKDLDGYTFSLPQESIEIILTKNPKAAPVRSIFVSYDVKQDFNSLVGRLRDYILPALTGLSPEELQQIKLKAFIDAHSNKEIDSI